MKDLLRLRRILAAPPPPRPATACEFCSSATGPEHSHVVDVENRRLMCVCRPCFLLFTHSGAAGGRYRSVGERYLQLPRPDVNPVAWEAFEIPVGVAFFLRSASLQRVLAFYPSPAGATESGLSLDEWDELVRANPALATLEPDIEALLLCRRDGSTGCWIVPVDICYELIGRLRKCWRGFDGGEEAKKEMDDFFSRIAARVQEAAAWSN